MIIIDAVTFFNELKNYSSNDVAINRDVNEIWNLYLAELLRTKI